MRFPLIAKLVVGKSLADLQLNDQFASPEDIRDFISSEREQMNEHEQKQMTVSLKIDDRTKMGIVQEVKLELRKASALKINYSSRKKVENPY